MGQETMSGNLPSPVASNYSALMGETRLECSTRSLPALYRIPGRDDQREAIPTKPDLDLWSRLQDSNPLHPNYKDGALPDELNRQIGCRGAPKPQQTEGGHLSSQH